MVALEDEIWQVLKSVPDPEIPVVDIVGLGMVRAVTGEEVVLTPTYTGCPATNVIRRDVEAALHKAGFGDVRVRYSLSPPWSTDAIDAETHEKLRRYGIAPPDPAHRMAYEGVPCPRCASSDTEVISDFGSTPCKAAMRCKACLEPFEHFKCL